jgi:hypothetical protein
LDIKCQQIIGIVTQSIVNGCIAEIFSSVKLSELRAWYLGGGGGGLGCCGVSNIVCSFHSDDVAAFFLSKGGVVGMMGKMGVGREGGCRNWKDHIRHLKDKH